MTTEEKETRGRKEVADPKRTITVGLRQSRIDKVGGVKKAQELIIQMIERYASK